MNDHIDIGEAVKFGWDTAKKNLKLLLGAMFITMVIPTALDSLSEMVREGAPLMYGVTQVFITVLSMFFGIGFLRLALSLYDGQEANIEQLFSGKDLLLYYIGGSLLYILIVAGGTLLLIVPGIIFAIRYQFCSLIIVDRGVEPLQSLRESSTLTDGFKWSLFQFFVVMMGLNLLGLLCFGVGLLVSIPVTVLAKIFVYRGLQSDDSLEDENVVPENNAENI